MSRLWYVKYWKKSLLLFSLLWMGACTGTHAEPCAIHGSDLIECGTTCINPKSDRKHCGGCGKSCASGKVCKNGQCLVSCLSGMAHCGEICVDLQSNPKHCGVCQQSCKDGEVCKEGKCANTACPAGLQMCEGTCVDLQKEDKNCGKCGVTCSQGKSCSTGKCICPQGQIDCSGKCIDVQADAKNCGKCSNACKNNLLCSKGQCVSNCQTGLQNCAGACVDTNKSKQHCGACGNTCKNNLICTKGKCGCLSGDSICNDICTTTKNNRSHCGKCGNKCSNKEICTGGKCVLSCPTGQVECAGACFDLQKSTKHCGTCGKQCANDEVCTSGKCVSSCPKGQTKCGGACFDLQSSGKHCGSCGKQCSNGEVCTNGKCLLSCSKGQTKCGSACFDLQKSTEHCGGCGKKCATGEGCVNGKCGCPTGSTMCNGKCTQLSSDKQNCGTCGNICTGSNICKSNRCASPDGCYPDWKKCGSDCKSILTDPSNCGACGRACGKTSVCQNGKCVKPWAVKAEPNSVRGIAVNAKGEVVIIGEYASKQTFGSISVRSRGFVNVFVAKLDVNGKFLWVTSMGNTKHNTRDQATGVAVSPSGDIYALGAFDSKGIYGSTTLTPKGSQDIFVAKLDTNGKFLWVKQAGGVDSIYPRDIHADSLGHIVLLGLYQKDISFGTHTLKGTTQSLGFVTKMDSKGAFLWAKQIVGKRSFTTEALATGTKGEIHIIGSFNNQMTFGSTTLTQKSTQGMYIAKLDANGKHLWAKGATRIGTGSSRGVDIAVDKYDNIYATGTYYQGIQFSDKVSLKSVGFSDVFVIKLNKDGLKIWSTSSRGKGSEGGIALSTTPDGNTYVFGSFVGEALLGQTKYQVPTKTALFFISKLSYNGHFEWSQRLALSNNGRKGQAVGITTDPQGNYYATGSFPYSATFGSRASISLSSKISGDLFVLKNIR